MWGTNYMLVHLEVLVAELVSMVRISLVRISFKSVWNILERNSCGCLGVLGSCGYCWVFLG